MSATPRLGLSHPTVVPTNYEGGTDPADGDDGHLAADADADTDSAADADDADSSA